MNWIPIDPDNLPEGVVLATDGTYYHAGVLRKPFGAFVISNSAMDSLHDVIAYCVIEPYTGNLQTRIVNGEEFTFKGTPVPYEGPKHT